MFLNSNTSKDAPGIWVFNAVNGDENSDGGPHKRISGSFNGEYSPHKRNHLQVSSQGFTDFI